MRAMKPLETIDKYLLLEEQEQTLLGSIFRAAEIVDGTIEKHLLVDLADARFSANPGFANQFANQSLISAKLEHPNILRKIKAVKQGNSLASVYEFHEGFSLEKVFRRCQSDMFPFTVDHALLVVSKLLSALSYAKTKHLNHGFVNPSQVFVTHEGEIKLRGFSFSSALSQFAPGQPELDPKFQQYMPSGMQTPTGDSDRLDIFGCGAILYEMLVGESYNASSGTAVAIIGQAKTDADGENIPPKIANILIRALDADGPNSYTDIQKMAKDMDELLFSGEYSPTTFNLAFFMHSAFREEMEALGGCIAEEKEKDFSGVAPAAAPKLPEPAPSVIMPEPPEPGPVLEAPAQVAQKSGGSKMGIIIGAIALVVIVILVVVLLPKGGDDKFAQQQEKLKAEGRQMEVERAQREQEAKDREIEQLKLLVQQQAEAERIREKKELEDEMLKMDQEIAQLKKQEDQQRRQAEIQAQLDKLKQEKLDLEEKERKAQEDRDRLAQLMAEREAEKKAQETPPVQPETSEETEPVSVAENSGDESNLENSVDGDGTLPVTPPDVIPAKEGFPEEGDLVDMNDEKVRLPTALDGYKILEIPRKAIRDGVVVRDRTYNFVMRVLINENGRVDEVELFKNPLKDADSDYGMIDRAKRAAKKLKYSEPTKMGVKVKVWMFVPIAFRSK